MDDVPVIAQRLAYRPPYDAAGMLEFLARRAVPGVEEPLEGGFRRSLRLTHGAGTVELRPGDGHIAARVRLDDPRDRGEAVGHCRALLDLDADPHAVCAALGDDPVLCPLVRAAPGRRVPGHVDGAELALRAVLGQQVSLAGAATLAGRLVTALGEPLARPLGAVTHLFPTARAFADADPSGWGLTQARARALATLVRALARGEIVLRRGACPDEARRRLTQLPGIGPWTVEYVAMRALGDRDAFLPTDLGVRRALELLGHDGRPASAERLARSWRPFRSYAVVHLWAQLGRRKTAA